jgi:hypothetical protein
MCEAQCGAVCTQWWRIVCCCQSPRGPDAPYRVLTLDCLQGAENEEVEEEEEQTRTRGGRREEESRIRGVAGDFLDSPCTLTRASRDKAHTGNVESSFLYTLFFSTLFSPFL